MTTRDNALYRETIEVWHDEDGEYAGELAVIVGENSSPTRKSIEYGVRVVGFDADGSLKRYAPHFHAETVDLDRLHDAIDQAAACAAAANSGTINDTHDGTDDE